MKLSINQINESLDLENQIENDLESDILDREHREFDGPFVPEDEQDWQDHFDNDYYEDWRNELFIDHSDVDWY